MNYYALQVRTRSETAFIKRCSVLPDGVPDALRFPQRKLLIRRKGRLLNHTAPIFPGYVFLCLPDDQPVSPFFLSLKGVSGFFKFLPSNQNIRPLAGRDLTTVTHFVSIKQKDCIAGVSKVFFNEQDRIVVLAGPLLGLEGRIIAVDKRKGRAKARLDLCQDSFTIDFAFEVLQKTKDARHAEP
jgi:transcriptional antiterminator NusG